MLAFRHLMAVSTGAVIALGYCLAATSQETPDLAPPTPDSSPSSSNEAVTVDASESSAEASLSVTSTSAPETLDSSTFSNYADLLNSGDTTQETEIDAPVIENNIVNPLSTVEFVTVNENSSYSLSTVPAIVPQEELATSPIPVAVNQEQENSEEDSDKEEHTEDENSENLVSQEEADGELEEESTSVAQEATPIKPEEDFKVNPVDPLPDSTSSGPSAPERLNPSADTLLFPTNPEEVQIGEVYGISLEQVIELALRNNRNYQAAKLQLDVANQQLQQALATEFPTLSTQLQFSRDDSENAELSLRAQGQDAPNTAATTTTSLFGTVQLNYNLYTGGSRPAQINVAEENIRLQELVVEETYEDTRSNATVLYYNLQDADAQTRIQEAAVEDATQSLRDAELLEQAGLGTRFSVLQAEVDLANSKQQLILARANQRTAQRQLVQFLSLAEYVELTAADDIQVAGSWELSLEESIIVAYRNRSEMEQFTVQRRIDEQQRQQALAAIRPQVSLFANYDVLGVLDDNLGPADGYALGATLQWTFFDGGAAKASAEQQKIEGEIAEVQFANQRNQVRLEVESAYFDLQANQENIQTATVAVELAEESLRLARLRFQAGVGTQTDVINAQTDLTAARGNLLSAIIDYNQALNSLQRAVSNLPDSRLSDIP